MPQARGTGAAGERVRLTVDLSAQLNAELERMAAETGRTKAELLRLGIDFLSRASAAKQEGMTVGAWKDNHDSGVRREREFVGVT
jgi:hypothetical protein